MKNWKVIAYPDDEGNKRQEAIIKAESYEQAQARAWRMFPEHHEVGAFEMKGEIK